MDRSAHRMCPKRRAMPANRQAACRPDRSRVSIRDGEEIAVCVLHVRERLTVRSGCLARCAHADGWKRILLPVFGDWRVDAVTAKDVRNWFDDLSVTRAASAKRTLAVLSSMMKQAAALSRATIKMSESASSRMRVPSWRRMRRPSTEGGRSTARRRDCRRFAFTISGTRSRQSGSTAARVFTSSPGCLAMPTSR